MAQSTVGGQPDMIRQGAFDASAIQEFQGALAEGQAAVLTGATDQVPFPGLVILNGANADAATLAAPVAGAQGPGSAAGDDGKTIRIIDASGKAHTVTTPSNKIANSKHVLTWNGTIGSNVELEAWNGVWYPIGTPNGVTIT